MDGMGTPASRTTIPRAIWPAPASPGGKVPDWAFLRHEVVLEGDVESAELHLAASSPEPGRQFVARLSMNGTELGQGPVRAVAGEHRVSCFDATNALAPGPNAIGVVAWTLEDHRVQVELQVRFRDGTSASVGSSEAWRGLPGERAYRPSGSIGTHYFVAPQEHLVGRDYPWGFDQPGFDDSAWAPATTKEPFTTLAPDPTAAVTTCEAAPVDIAAVGPGTLRFDFGGTYVGGLSLPGLGRPAQLTLRFGELLDEHGRVRAHMATGNHYEDRWELDGHEPQIRTWGLRVFRYLEIDGLPPEAAESVRALGHVHPLGGRTRFRTDDPRLQQVLDLCEHTIVQTNGPLLVDSWSREREPYEADAYLQAKANAALSAEQELAGYSLDYLLQRRTWPTEWPFYLVLLAAEHAERGGDLDALAARRDRLAALLPTDWIDPATGLIRKLHGSDGSASVVDHDIVDWPPSERDGYQFGPVNTAVNAVAHGAFSAMARIDELLGHPDAPVRAEHARRLRETMNALLWDEEAGTFIDGLDADCAPLPHAAAHAGAFASALGVADADRAARIAAHLAPLGMPVSVYAAPFLLRALLRGGRADAAFDLLVATGDRSWLGMIEAGAGATMEAWNEQVKPNVSCAHPWGASPLFLVVEDLLGLRPLAPGYTEFAVAPQVPEQIGHLGASVPTVAGLIEIDVSGEAAGRAVRVSVPEGTRCRLRWDGEEQLLGPGPHAFDRNR